MAFGMYVGIAVVLTLVCYFVNYALHELDKLNKEINELFDQYSEIDDQNNLLKSLLADALVGSQVMASERSITNMNDYYLSICDCRTKYNTDNNTYALVIDYNDNGKVNSIEI